MLGGGLKLRCGSRKPLVSARRAQPFFWGAGEVGFGHRASVGAEACLLHTLEVLLEFLPLWFLEADQRTCAQTAEQRDHRKAIDFARHLENIARAEGPLFDAGAAFREGKEQAAPDEQERDAASEPKVKMARRVRSATTGSTGAADLHRSLRMRLIHH